MKIKIICTALILSCFTTYIAAQPKPKEKKTLWDRIYVGGNVGFQFGTVTDIEVSPHIGYKLYPRLSVGVGLTYEYYKQKANIYNPYNINTHIYGYSLFSRVTLIEDLGKTFGIGNGISIIGQAEYERLSLDNIFKYYSTEEGRFWIDSFLVGGGISQAMGRRSSVYMMIMWNLNETVNTPYSNPIFKFGFDF